MEEIIVAKFGGSSLADSNQFIKVKNIVKEDPRRKYIIPSAPGKRNSKDHKITDLLYMCHQLASHHLNFEEVYIIIEKRYKDICEELKLDVDIDKFLSEIKENIKNGGSRDYAASRGEYLNAVILSNYLDYEFIDSKDIIIFDNKGNFDLEKTEKKVESNFKNSPYGVIPGFYGAKENGDIVTFSRGGSDVTGAIITSLVGAKLYENWTDVSGFLMADPRIVNNPKPIEIITYKELRELSYMGAPVLHEEAIFPVKNTGIPINIKNTNFPEDPGTMIMNDNIPIRSGTITGISGKKDFTVISIEKTLMNAETGFIRKLISVFETNDVSIENIPSGIDSISIIVSNVELNGKLNKIMEEIRIYCNPDTITFQGGMALLAVVGRGMIKSKGISGKIFTALGNRGVNIRMITQGSSELNIIIGIENSDFDMAMTAIYEAFENDNLGDD